MMRRSIRLTAPIALIAAIVIFHALGWLAPIERWFFRLGNTISAPAASGAMGLRAMVRNLNRDLWAENEMLRARVAALESERRGLIEDTEELVALRTALQLREASGMSSVVARVVGSETGSGRELVITNRGARDGIAVGDPVITTHGFLFGVVADAREGSSAVLSLFDTSSRIAASAVENPATIGVVEGGFGLVVRFGLIPLEAELEVGNTIQTSGGGSRIPPGIFIGRVEQIREEPHTPFKSAVITPFESLGGVTELIIVHP